MAYVSSDELPKNFDVIVYGTGLTESIIAAALCRNGVSVLHLDYNQFYGGECASLMYREFIEFLKATPRTPQTQDNNVQSTEDQSSNSQRYFLRSDLSRIYENIEQDFVEQSSPLLPEVTPVTTNVTPNITSTDCANNYSLATDTDTKVTSHEETSQSIHHNSDSTEVNEDNLSPAPVTTFDTPTSTQESTQPTQKDNKSSLQESQPTLQDSQSTLQESQSTLQESQPTLQESQPTLQDGQPTLQDGQPTLQDSQSILQDSQSTLQESQPTLQDTQSTLQDNQSTQDKETQLLTPSSHTKISTPSTDPVLSWTELKSQHRMFTFDLWPKLIYATDPFVDMIVKSSVTKYLEFKAVNKIITVLDGNLTLVPASRADVFTSKTVSVLEKRLLMRFVTFVMDLDEHTEEVEKYNARPFSEFMEHMRLNAKLRALIKSSIAQVEDDSLTEVALERSKFYLQSIGRYSNSPYLWPVYGIGELPQAFCRMAAVFGGLYMLRKEIRYLEIIETEGVSKCHSVRDTENTTFLCKHIILGVSLVPDPQPTIRYSRAILATNRKLLPPNTSDINSDIGFITIPSHTLGPNQSYTIKIIELSPKSQSCPDRCYLVHITCCSSQNTAKADLLPVVEFLFNNSTDNTDIPPAPKVLYSIYFNYNSTQAPTGNKSKLADNIHLISSPDLEPSYQQILSEAKGVFDTICPGDTFLPPPPDPEDIIYEPTPPEQNQIDIVESAGDSLQPTGTQSDNETEQIEK
ncbi:Rab proteins geranylgeranyltransferase component A 1-like isoform X2 [Oopsacas minuta]|uniref:Rab proteins geranylgeranyltransferase component A 1-like isoform X2 n=1 Tax=Oopsacas minuta TaxID=111878 RepID=A0AAV7JIV7_9METZ|nr:Rab proteins geranylgeranyltransferase component A 1-like isoform X2 [Oopsacas minuta]